MAMPHVNQILKLNSYNVVLLVSKI